MHAWEQIQQTIDWIETHLDREIEIEKLAQMAALSPFYYQRLFTRLVKRPVAEYVKLRRMARATELLVKKDGRILDVAMELGFSSHGHFSRCFKQTFGMTPDEYRKRPRFLNSMSKPELLLHYVLVDEGVPLITDGIVLEINRRRLERGIFYCGMKTDMPVPFIDGLGTESGENSLDTLWRTLHREKVETLAIDEDGEEVGVTLPCQREGYFSYFAGTESGEEKQGLPERFFSWELPAGEYVVCSFEAENFHLLVTDALYKAEQYLFNTWMPGHGLQSEPFCAERYGRHLPETAGMEVWLKLAEG